MAWRRPGRQAIIWTNADPVHWRIYVALAGDELRPKYMYVALSSKVFFLNDTS